MTDADDLDPIAVLEATAILIDRADEGVRHICAAAAADDDPASWLPPLGRMLHLVEEIHDRYGSLQRELRLAVGSHLDRLSPTLRRRWEDTLGLRFEPAKPKQVLRSGWVAGRVAARLADDYGKEPPAVLAREAVDSAFRLAGVTASTKLRVGQMKAWGFSADDVYDQDGSTPAQATAVRKP